MNGEIPIPLIEIFVALIGGNAVLLMTVAWFIRRWLKNADERSSIKLKSDVAIEAQKAISDYKKELDLEMQKDLGNHFNRVNVYKSVVRMMSEILNEHQEIAINRANGLPLDALKSERFNEVFERFKLSRLVLYGDLSLSSTQEVMNAYNNFMDHLLEITYLEIADDLAETRDKVITPLLNEMRKDLGLREGEIFYKGRL